MGGLLLPGVGDFRHTYTLDIQQTVLSYPTGLWTAQQFRNLSIVEGELPRYLLHDRDSKFTAHGDALLGDVGGEAIRLPVRFPNLNAYAVRGADGARGVP
jgi:hypothetical protein